MKEPEAGLVDHQGNEGVSVRPVDHRGNEGVSVRPWFYCCTWEEHKGRHTAVQARVPPPPTKPL